jgi:hypothetical protein
MDRADAVRALREAAAEMTRVAVEGRPWTPSESWLWERAAVAAGDLGVKVMRVPDDDEETTAEDLTALAENFLRAAARLEGR